MKQVLADKTDWQEIRRRLERAVSATERALALTPEQVRAVLEERARILARVPDAPLEAAATIEVVTFALACERYAVEARYVREMSRFQDCTPIPGAPPFLRGVVNLRGEILAVVDLKTFFCLPAQGGTALSRVLVLGAERAEFGVWVDAVEEVRPLRRADILEPPATIAGAGRDWLRGVTADATIVLDAAVLLQTSRLFIDEGDEPGT